jgi:IS5 family transposase
MGLVGRPHILQNAGRHPPHGIWTVKFAEAKPKQDGSKPVDIAIPVFGDKSHISIDRKHGVIRRHKVTDAAAADGARLREGLIDRTNTAGDVWPTAPTQANGEFLDRLGKTSRIHRKKPMGSRYPRPCGAPTQRGQRAPALNMSSPSRRTAWACSSEPSALPARNAVITVANMAYNMKRWCWLVRRPVAG